MRVCQNNKSSETTLSWVTPPSLVGTDKSSKTKDLGEVANGIFPADCILSEDYYCIDSMTTPRIIVGLTMALSSPRTLINYPF